MTQSKSVKRNSQVVRFKFSTLVLAFILPITVLNHANSQVISGSAVGWVVDDSFSTPDEIAPGENSTAVNSGPGVFATPVPITQVSPDNSAWAQTEFPNLRVLADSTLHNNNPTTKTAYAGAYFGDSLTFTGGVGSFELRMRWDFEGAISGSGGSYSVGPVGPTGGQLEGSAAADFRVLLQPFGDSALDLSQTDLFKDLATYEYGALEIPYFDPFEPFAGSSSGPGFGNFLFDEFDDYGEPTGAFIDGPYTDENANFVTGIGGGARFTWEYGVPLNFGVLLQGWATDGGIVDFSNTGTFAGLEVPAGTTVNSVTGGNYDVTFVSPNGDFNSDGVLDCQDVDALVADIAAGSDTADFDLTGDGTVDGADLDAWLVEGGANNPALTGGNAFLHGDINLNGVVDISDFNEWNSNKFTANASWCAGDMNADGSIDTSDFNLWNGNKFQSSSSIGSRPADSLARIINPVNVNTSAVPEPGTLPLCIVGLFGLSILKRRNPIV